MRGNFEPFESAEEVWFWFCNSILARGDGLRSKSDYWGKPRCCEISDIYRIIKIMKRRGHMSNRHLRVMAKWGNKRLSPWDDKYAKRSEVRLWEEGIYNFEVYLKFFKILPEESHAK